MAVLLSLAAAATQAAASEPPGERVTLSATAGMSRPVEALFRDVYGGAVAPLAAQASVRLAASGLGLFAGVRNVRANGEAVVAGGTAIESPEAVEFRMTTVRVGVMHSLSRGAWTVGAGVGASYGWYREEWPSFGRQTTGARAGLIGQASAARWISRRWAVLVRGEFSVVSPARATGDPEEVRLGGLDLGAGVAFRF